MKILQDIGLWTRKSQLQFGKRPESTDLHQASSNGVSDQTITADHIFKKILSEIYLGTRKS